MNLGENLREPIRKRDMATKVDMLCNFRRRQLASQVSGFIIITLFNNNNDYSNSNYYNRYS